jgi:regulator of replication initiation timing
MPLPSPLDGLTTQVADLTTQVADLTTQVADLTTQVADLTTQVTELRADNDTLRADNDTLRADNDTLNVRVTDLTTQVTELHQEQTRRECLAQGAELLQVYLQRVAGNAADKRRFLAAAHSFVDDYWNLGIYDTPAAAAAALVLVMDDCLPDRDPALTGDVMLAMLELKEARNTASHPVRVNDRNQHAPLVDLCDAHAADFTALLPRFAPAVASMVQVVRGLLETH